MNSAPVASPESFSQAVATMVVTPHTKALPSPEVRRRIAESLSTARAKRIANFKPMAWKGKQLKERKNYKRVAVVHTRYGKIDSQSLMKRWKQRVVVIARSRAFWVCSSIFHGMLLVVLSLVGMGSMIQERMESVTSVTDLWQIETKFHEPPPPLPESEESLPELLKADMKDEAEDFSVLNRPQETPPDPKTSPAQMADLQEPEADNKPVEGEFQESSAGVAIEIGKIDDSEWAKIRPKTLGTGTSGGAGGAGEGVIGTQTGTGAGFGTAQATGTGSAGQGSGSGSGPSYGASALNMSGGVYPKRAMKEQREGIVHLRVEVLDNGMVGQIELQQSSGHKDLDETAIDAARKWRFRPAMKDGKPVSMWVTVPVRYRLKDA